MYVFPSIQDENAAGLSFVLASPPRRLGTLLWIPDVFECVSTAISHSAPREIDII